MGAEKVMKKIIPYVKCLFFMAGLIVLVALSDFLFAETGYVDYMLKQINSDKENYEEVILGASHARAAIDPNVMQQGNEDDLISAAVPGETIKDSYYLAQEVCRNNDVERIILDIDYNYWFGNLGEGCFAEAFLYNQYSWLSPVKWKYLIENPEYLDFRNAMSKCFVYSLDGKKIQKNVTQKLSSGFQDGKKEAYDFCVDGTYSGRGFFYMNLPKNNPVGKKYVHKQMGIEQQEVNPYPVKYFRKLVDYCRNNDIELICVTSPITPSNMKKLGLHEAYAKLTEIMNEEDVTYFDFNRTRFDVLERKDTDYIDHEGHMGGEVAEKYSILLSEVLKKYEDGTLDMEDYFYDSYEKMYEVMGD